jgi:hypothetical protein
VGFGLLALAGSLSSAIAAEAPRDPIRRIAMDIPDVSLSAQHVLSSSELRIRYTIANKSKGDIYVLDARRVRGANGQPAVAADLSSLVKNDAGDAEVLVGIAPLPDNKLVAVRIMPVATKLAPGASQTRELRPIPLPLTEQTPYVTTDEIANAQITTVRQVVLGVQFIRASTPALVATPLPFAPSFYDVKTPQTAEDAREVAVVLIPQAMPLRIVPGPR